MTSEAYVFIDGLEDSPIICGFFKLNPQTGRGEFNYGKSYLARSDAFAPLGCQRQRQRDIGNYKYRARASFAPTSSANSKS